jgi:hypothetical protein
MARPQGPPEQNIHMFYMEVRVGLRNYDILDWIMQLRYLNILD